MTLLKKYKYHSIIIAFDSHLSLYYSDLYAEFQKLKAGKKLSEKENTKLPGDQKNEVYQHLYQLEHNQSFFSKLLNLKSQNAKLQKLVIGMKAIVEYYEKRTGAKLPEELLTDIDLRKIFEESNLEGGLKLLKSKWDAEKQEIINKYEEEIRNYQSKITGLLSQLRAEQKKNKDAFKGSKYPNEMDLSKQKIELLFSKDVVDELKEENNALKLKIREFEEKLMNSAKGLAASGGAGGKNSPEYLLLHQKMVENQEKYLQLEKKLKLFESMNSQNQNNSSQKNEEVQLLKQRVQELNEAEWQYGNRMKEYEDIIGSMKKEIVKNLQSKQSNKTRVKNFVKNAQKEIKEIRSTLASIEMMVSSQKAGFFTSLKTVYYF